MVNCLVECLKRHLGGENGSEIVNEMKLSNSKGEYLSKRGIAKTYLDETVEELFTWFDESEMNRNHECDDFYEEHWY